MIHHKKIFSKYFVDVANGVKPFEIRRDPMRTLNNGDFIKLHELSDDLEETGRTLLVQITYMVRGPFEQAGLPDGTVVMTINRCSDIKYNDTRTSELLNVNASLNND